jgi:TatA/E family protein of Tat protein translocase
MPSSGEIFVILIVVFILFGGKGLQEVARTLGKWTRKIQNASREFQRELNLDEIRREINDDATPRASRSPYRPDAKSSDLPNPESEPGKSDLQG